MSSCLREWAAIRPDVTLAKIASAKGRGQLSAVLAEDVVRPVAEAELVAQPAQQPLHAPILVGVVPVELDEDRLDGTCAPVWDETVTMRCLSDGRAQAEAQRTWAGLPVSKGAGAHQSTVERTAYSEPSTSTDSSWIVVGSWRSRSDIGAHGVATVLCAPGAPELPAVLLRPLCQACLNPSEARLTSMARAPPPSVKLARLLGAAQTAECAAVTPGRSGRLCSSAA